MQRIVKPHKDKYVLTYSDLDKVYHSMVTYLKKYNLTHVYGIPRGGLAPMVHMSHHLDLEPVYDIHEYINEYNLENIDNKPAQNILIIDDIADSGVTLLETISFLDDFDIQYKTATLFMKPQSKVMPHYYHIKVPNDTWVYFPWEVKF